MAVGTENERHTSKGQAWFCTSGLPSDIVIEVEEMTYHLHKFPLMSKSRKFDRLIADEEQRRLGNSMNGSAHDEIEEIKPRITLPDFPGGSDAFEAAAKFCYGTKVELNSITVVALRCAAEYLEMTEEYSEDNLIAKTEMFLTDSVLKSLKDSVYALKSCEQVLPLAETLAIVGRCIESVSRRAFSSNPVTLFGWPVRGDDGNSRNQILWNGIESAIRRKSTGSGTTSWLEQVAALSLPLFKRLILAMRSHDVNPEIIESCLIYFAGRNIPGISRSSRIKPPATCTSTSSGCSSSSSVSESEQREVLEVVITNMPMDLRGGATSSPAITRFLFGLLRTAIILNAPDPIRSALERKVGSQLDQAALDDLLIPSYSYLNETLYDVDCVNRILSHFLDRVKGARKSSGVEGDEEEENGGAWRSPALNLVGKLIDGYLAEIASDSNLKPERFCNLAMSIPERARLFDDTLYRAVDVYLKAHPWITEAEREMVCGVMDCQKLTLEACTHAAQNERLPLRSVVQVLFFEQLQLRNAIAGSFVAAESSLQQPPPVEQIVVEEEQDEAPPVEQGTGKWRETVRENQVLRLDMDSMRVRLQQLERECSTMKKVIAQIDTKEEPSAPSQQPAQRKSSLSRKLGCKFTTQVCDSHEQIVADPSRQHRRRSQLRSALP